MKSEHTTERISVLLVDDQPMVAEGIRRMLATDAGIAFSYVSDPTRAVEAAEKICPTVILQDLVMPGVNGLDLLKEYRNSPQTREIPVIVLSTREQPVIKQAAFEAGASDYLIKLPDRIELLARVRLHSQGYLHELQRRAAFQALEKAQAELLGKNAELVQLNNQLAEVTRSKSEFFANMSHEIRTPMVGVLGVADVLADTPLSAPQKDLVEVIRTSGETLLRIINDILDLSKMESGKLELESTPFLLSDAIDQVMELLAPGAFAKDLDIIAWVSPQLPATVLGDITRLRQILLNLVGNAVKFTAGGEIYLEVNPSFDGPNMVHFSLEDTGIGVAPEKLDRLFQAFSQVDASTTRHFGGTGLGLSICRTLTKLMGGRIWVESAVGKGTRFHFTISLPPVISAEPGRNVAASTGKRLMLMVKNVRLLRQLATWAEELALEVVIRSDPAESLRNTRAGYLIIDADACRSEIPASSQMNGSSLILLTRARNRSEWASLYPAAIVLGLPLRKARFLQAISDQGVPLDVRGPRNGASVLQRSLADLNVLIVDDTAVNRFVAVALLKKLGVRNIMEVENGREAVDAAVSEAFDLILMDVQMPGIDGLQATREIRALLRPARQPYIVALTANALDEERERCVSAGMDDKLVKPVVRAELEAVLQASAARVPAG
ncbi:MAG TPA: response regulator [Chthoniobacterales bacterium]